MIRWARPGAEDDISLRSLRSAASSLRRGPLLLEKGRSVHPVLAASRSLARARPSSELPGEEISPATWQKRGAYNNFSRSGHRFQSRRRLKELDLGSNPTISSK